jgi:hypothetical protein
VATPVSGFLYADVQFAGQSVKGAGMKKLGEACATGILGLIATGDASIKTAAKGRDVVHVDHSAFNILGLYTKSCTIAYGAGAAGAAAAVSHSTEE